MGVARLAIIIIISDDCSCKRTSHGHCIELCSSALCSTFSVLSIQVSSLMPLLLYSARSSEIKSDCALLGFATNHSACTRSMASLGLRHCPLLATFSC